MPGWKDHTEVRDSAFVDFGQSILADESRQEVCKIDLPEERLEARRLLRELCPRVPGIYGWLDRNDQIIYVGKSKSLRMRLLSYFSKTPPDEKMRRIRQQSCRLAWEPVCHEMLALVREQELIHRLRPGYNSQGQPHRRRPAFLCLSDGVAPYAFLSRQISSKSQLQLGPIAGTRELGTAIESLNYVFQLRDCSDQVRMRFSNQPTLFEDVHHAKCLRYELNSCPGPCAGVCSKDDYSAGVQRALQFLNGGDLSILVDLQREMESAAARKSYERAAVLRDQIDHLRWLSRRLETLRKAHYELNCVYEVPGFEDRAIWVLLDGGQIKGCMPRPRNRRSAERVRKELQQMDRTAGDSLPEGPLATNWQLIVISWFKKHPDLIPKLLPIPEAIRHCDGRIEPGMRISA